MRAAIAVVLGLMGACFSEAEKVSTPCPAGAEGCPCLDAQCEAGLSCDGMTCVAAGTGTTSDSDSGTRGTSTTGSADDAASDEAGTPVTSSESSTGEVDLCGNGILDEDEECDGTPGCSDACEFEEEAWSCNPLNNAPCPSGFKCSIIEPTPGDVQSVCLPVPGGPPIQGSDDPPPGGLHDSNCVYGGEPHDEWCDLGLACAYSSLTDACESNCCVEFCDLTRPIECAWMGDVCEPFFLPGIPAGLAHLGWCVRP